MASRESKRTVIVAIVSNAVIAAIKFAAAAITGSSAMLSEGIHSLVDTGDGLLIWVGVKASRKPPDRKHPFGYGQELYFWIVVVAVLVFAVGGGMSAYEGIVHLVNPAPIRVFVWSYLVLGAALLLEGISWGVAFHSFQKERRSRSVWQTIQTSKDPTTFAVLFEDTAAVSGLMVALAGVALSQILRSPYPDAIASIVVGLLLMMAAVLLAQSARRLVTGESAEPALVAALSRTIEEDAAIEQVTRLTTVHFGPDTVLANVEARFSRRLTAEDLPGAIDRIQRMVRIRHRHVKYLFLEAEELTTMPRPTSPR
jgi:cation diffusion facilitator family transporter